jgi:Lon protease-like protein
VQQLDKTDFMMRQIPLFPLSHGLFPDGMLSLQIFEVRYLDLIKRCHQQQLPFGVAWLKKGSEVQVPGETPMLHVYGCCAHIRDFEQVQPNLFRVTCQGGLRFKLNDTQPGPFGVWQGDISILAQDPEVEIPATLAHHAGRLGKIIASAQKQGQLNRLPILQPYLLDQCGWVANRYAEALGISAALKVQLLCELDPLKRLETIDSLIRQSGDDSDLTEP